MLKFWKVIIWNFVARFDGKLHPIDKMFLFTFFENTKNWNNWWLKRDHAEQVAKSIKSMKFEKKAVKDDKKNPEELWSQKATKGIKDF